MTNQEDNYDDRQLIKAIEDAFNAHLEPGERPWRGRRLTPEVAAELDARDAFVEEHRDEIRAQLQRDTEQLIRERGYTGDLARIIRQKAGLDPEAIDVKDSLVTILVMVVALVLVVGAILVTWWLLARLQPVIPSGTIAPIAG